MQALLIVDPVAELYLPESDSVALNVYSAKLKMLALPVLQLIQLVCPVAD